VFTPQSRGRGQDETRKDRNVFKFTGERRGEGDHIQKTPLGNHVIVAWALIVTEKDAWDNSNHFHSGGGRGLHVQDRVQDVKPEGPKPAGFRLKRAVVQDGKKDKTT